MKVAEYKASTDPVFKAAVRVTRQPSFRDEIENSVTLQPKFGKPRSSVIDDGFIQTFKHHLRSESLNWA
jgi:hypothetical protein